MKRFLHVRGKAGLPVQNPHIDDPTRLVGQRLKAQQPDPAELLSAMDAYEPCDEVIVDHPDLAKPIKKGSLTLLGKVGMADIEKARAHFASPGVVAVEATKKGRVS